MIKKYEVTSVLPTRFRIEIFSILNIRETPFLSEIRLRLFGMSSITVSGERIMLVSRITAGELEDIVTHLTHGAPYAYRDTVADGYITLPSGIRVGICGNAKYDGDTLVGISSPSSLVFRIPSAGCELCEEVYSAFLKAERGLLIYARAGAGKTSAIRELVGIIGGREPRKNVVVVDERCEFIPEYYTTASVDILRGYKRARGMEIALRTLGAEVIVIDEIGSLCEVSMIGEFMRSGAVILATAHANDLEDLSRKRGVASLISLGAFDVFFGIDVSGGRRSFRVDGYSAVLELLNRN